MDNYKTILFPYAYNILGSVVDAEDAIQDVIIRYTGMDKSKVDNPKNYLIKSVINQSIVMKKKKMKLVSVDEVWLPEPVATENAYSSGVHDELAGFSLLANLEYLNPKERAILVLKDGFNYSHEEIAETLTVSVENSRKILSRAKDRLQSLGRNIKAQKKAASSESVKKLIEAIQNKDNKQVENLLSEEIRFTADGGKTINVVARLQTGVTEVAKLMIHVFHAYNKNQSMVFTEINHQPGIIFMDGDQVRSCQVFDVIEDKIIRIHSVIDPEKLRRLEASMRSV